MFQVQGIARGGGVLASLGCVWAVGVVGVLLFAGEDTVMPGSGSRIVAMQQGGLQRAIAGLNSEDRRSKQMLKSGFRTSQLASADDGLNWLEKIQGKVLCPTTSNPPPSTTFRRPPPYAPPSTLLHPRCTHGPVPAAGTSSERELNYCRTPRTILTISRACRPATFLLLATRACPR